MPTPKTWTDRAADILLDERNKRYLGMTEPTADQPHTAAGRAPDEALIEHAQKQAQTVVACLDSLRTLFRLHACPDPDAHDEAAADPSGLRAWRAEADDESAFIVERAEDGADYVIVGGLGWQQAQTLASAHNRAALAAKGSGSSDPEPTPPASDPYISLPASDLMFGPGRVALTPPASGPLTSGSNEPEGLDVERLAIAFDNLHFEIQYVGPGDGPIEAYGDLIAAEYARLTAATSASSQEAEA